MTTALLDPPTLSQERLAERLDAEPRLQCEFLKVFAARHLAFFCRHVLGYRDMNPEHEALCAFLQDHPAAVKLVLMPRHSFKSCLGTIGYSLWRLLQNPNARVLIQSDSAEKAEGFLLAIKQHILGLSSHSRFRTICGPWEVDPQRGVWNQSAIVIRPRAEAAVEPSVDTAGLDTSKVGKHYDEILFDDVVTDKTSTTKDLMEKTVECYRKARSLLKPGGRILLSGTRWHFGDLYGWLMAQGSSQADFSVFRRDGEVAPDGAPYPFADIGLTREFLTRQKAEQGTRIYSCLYRLSPHDDETAIFKAKDFRFYQPIHNETWERWVASLYVTCVLDAIPPPVSDHGDEAAITVVGTDHANRKFLLEAVSGRWTPERQISEVLSLHARWRIRRFGLETNAFQRMLKVELDDRLSVLRQQPGWMPFSIVEFQGVTQGNKEQRIQGLQPWHEQGSLLFPGETLEGLTGVWSKLAFQMLQFPHMPQDDLLDSLAYHLQLVRPGYERPQAVVYPPTSADWYERTIWRPEQLKVRQRMPRFRRPPMPELAFT